MTIPEGINYDDNDADDYDYDDHDDDHDNDMIWWQLVVKLFCRYIEG